MLFAVEYVYDQARTSDLDALRPEHRAFLQELHEQGPLITSGPWQDAAAPGALLLVEGEDIDEVFTHLNGDPFHRAQLIVRRTARPWQPVIGTLSS